MVVYSAGKEPYLTKLGIRNIKAAFARQIFRHDLLQVYVEQTNHRNELTQRSRDILSDIISRINSDGYDNPIVTDLLLKLSEQMKHHKGKKIYGYLPQAGRNIVNAVVDELAKDKDISALYGQKTWHLFTIDYILNNERYMGDCLLQKSYTTESLPFTKKRNRGEKAQYYCDGCRLSLIRWSSFCYALFGI